MPHVQLIPRLGNVHARELCMRCVQPTVMQEKRVHAGMQLPNPKSKHAGVTQHDGRAACTSAVLAV